MWSLPHAEAPKAFVKTKICVQYRWLDEGGSGPALFVIVKGLSAWARKHHDTCCNKPVTCTPSPITRTTGRDWLFGEVERVPCQTSPEDRHGLLEYSPSVLVSRRCSNAVQTSRAVTCEPIPCLKHQHQCTVCSDTEDVLLRLHSITGSVSVPASNLCSAELDFSLGFSEDYSNPDV